MESSAHPFRSTPTTSARAASRTGFFGAVSPDAGDETRLARLRRRNNRDVNSRVRWRPTAEASYLEPDNGKGNQCHAADAQQKLRGRYAGILGARPMACAAYETKNGECHPVHPSPPVFLLKKKHFGHRVVFGIKSAGMV